MRQTQSQNRRCSYVVALDEAMTSLDELQVLAQYLSSLQIAGCEILILDSAEGDEFERNHRVLRWVGRHVAVRSERTPSGEMLDVVRFASSLASCERVVVADAHVRYAAFELDQICDMLESHEVVEPQDYFDPLPWWGGVEAGRILVHRGIDPYPDHGATFGFRKAAAQALQGLELSAIDGPEDPVRRLAAYGAEVFPAHDVFVRREPPQLSTWIRQRVLQADDDFDLPMKTAFFFSLIPAAMLLTLFVGLRALAFYGFTVALGALLLALRGRAGAGAFFPLRACLFAPLWVAERSVSVYWALFRKVSGTALEPLPVRVDDQRRNRVASGE